MRVSSPPPPASWRPHHYLPPPPQSSYYVTRTGVWSLKWIDLILPLPRTAGVSEAECDAGLSLVRAVTTLASHWSRQARQPALGHRDQSDSQGRATASCAASSLVSNTRMLAADWPILSPPPALTGRHYSLIPILAASTHFHPACPSWLQYFTLTCLGLSDVTTIPPLH